MAVTDPPALVMTGIHFAHAGGRARLIDVSLTADDGDIVCLLGPNGAGKTTVLRCLLGLLTPSRGTITLNGTPVSSLSARQRARHVAYVPQSVQTAFPFTALDMAVMGRTPHLGPMRTPSAGDRRTARRVLADLGIERVADQPFASLSGGERGLTLVARAVVQEARMLVLDEPTAALDLGNAVRVLAVLTDLARRGHTVVMTTHQPDHALRGAHRAVLIRGGRVVAAGRPRDVLTTSRLSDVYGTPVQVGSVRLPGRDDPIPVCVAEIGPTATPPPPEHHPREDVVPR